MNLDRVVAVIPGERTAEGVTMPLFIMESGKCWWRVEARPGRPSTEVEWVPAGPPVPETVAAGASAFGPLPPVGRRFPEQLG